MISQEKLAKLRDKYEEKADYYWENYQMDGQTSHLRSYERNSDLAEAMACAASATLIQEELSILKLIVMELRPDDEGGDLVLAVKRIQKRIAEGKVV